MDYILAENKGVLVGPGPWKPRYIQSELDDLDISFTVSPTEPEDYLKITDEVEVFPVTEMITPDYDSTYEHLNGPFWNFEGNEAKGYYTKSDNTLEYIKSALKQKIASQRYQKEVGGVKTTIQDTEITVETDKETRNIFVQKYILMGDQESINWKFPETWLVLNKVELGTIIFTGATYIQEQFDWEKGLADQIEAAQSIEELKIIDAGI